LLRDFVLIGSFIPLQDGLSSIMQSLAGMACAPHDAGTLISALVQCAR
jgi:hypothetical protein